MKRKICLLLAMLMILSVAVGLSACKKDDQGGVSTTVTTLPTSGDGDAPVDLYADLPTGNYGGYEFNILNNYPGGDNITTMAPEGDTKDTVLAAVFSRNSVVKEKLGIEIKEQPMNHGSIKSTMTSLTSSGDFEYDIVFNETYDQTALAQLGTYLSTYDYTDSINLDKPWWFTDSMESIAIDGTNYELYGDFHLQYYNMIWGLAFNQQDFFDNKIPFPYDMVRAGDWTIDEMEKIIKVTAAAMGDKHYGVASHKGFITAMIAASDFALVTQDDDDVLKVFDNSTRFEAIYTKIMNAFFASNGDGKLNFIWPDGASEANKSGNFKDGASFVKGEATFMGEVVEAIIKVREATFNYGILPLPKYSTDQETYVSFISRVSSSCGIPTTTLNGDNGGIAALDRTCVIIENLSAHSYKMVKPEYYDIVVQGRTVRDTDSMEMLDIMFGNSDKGKAVFEIDYMYTLGLSDEIRKCMCDNITAILVSLDGVMGTVESNIETMIEAYK